MGRKLFGTLVSAFILLALIKAVLFLHLSSHLFELHYWINVTVMEWDNSRWTFACFILVLVSSLLCVSYGFYREQDSSALCIRSILIIVPLFVLFSAANLSIRESSYLYSYLKGVLNAEDIFFCTVNDLFLRAPYLFYYGSGFAAVIVFLLRYKKSAWFGYFITIFMAVYFIFNAGCFTFAIWPYLLLTVFGLVSLAARYLVYTERPMPLLVQYFPLYPFIFINAAFSMTGHYRKSILGFPLYHTVAVLLFISAAVALAWYFFRKYRFYIALSSFMPFYLVAFFFHSNLYFPVYANINKLFFYSQVFGHYLKTELFFVMALGFVSLLLSRWFRNRTVYGFLYVMILFALVISCFDLRACQLTATRLSWKMIFRGGIEENPWLLLEIIGKELNLLVVSGVLIVILIFLVVQYGARWLCDRMTDTGTAGLVIGCLIAFIWIKPLFFGTDQLDGHAFSNIFFTSPYITSIQYNKMSDDDFLARYNRYASYVRAEKKVPAPKKLNLLIVILESSHSMYLSMFNGKEETQPLLSAYRDRMELFTNYYSTFQDSFQSRVSIFSSLYLVREYLSRFNPDIPAKTLFETLHEEGYRNSIFISSYIKYCGLDKYLDNRKVDVIYDSFNMPNKEKFRKFVWGIDEKAALEAITDRLSEHQTKGENFFITYISSVPHYPYELPDTKFNIFSSEGEGSDFATAERERLRALYKNGLLYMDWVTASIVAQLEKNGQLDDTIVIITSDHGEQVGEYGTFGHGFDLHPNYTLVPLIIMNPGRKGFRLNTKPGTHTCIMPTVLGEMGIPLPEGLSQGYSMYSDQKSEYIYLDSYGDRALVSETGYLLERNSASGKQTYLSFQIEHQENRTFFKLLNETGENDQAKTRLREFNEFQNSMLRFYGDYIKLLR